MLGVRRFNRIAFVLRSHITQRMCECECVGANFACLWSPILTRPTRPTRQPNVVKNAHISANSRQPTNTRTSGEYVRPKINFCAHDQSAHVHRACAACAYFPYYPNISIICDSHSKLTANRVCIFTAYIQGRIVCTWMLYTNVSNKQFVWIPKRRGGEVGDSRDSKTTLNPSLFSSTFWIAFLLNQHVTFDYNCNTLT